MGNALENGTRVSVRIAGRPARRFRPYGGGGIQSDDIGGYYEEVRTSPEVRVEAVVTEMPVKGKPKRFVRWTDGDGKVFARPLYKFKRGDIVPM